MDTLNWNFPIHGSRVEYDFSIYIGIVCFSLNITLRPFYWIDSSSNTKVPDLIGGLQATFYSVLIENDWIRPSDRDTGWDNRPNWLYLNSWYNLIAWPDRTNWMPFFGLNGYILIDFSFLVIIISFSFSSFIETPSLRENHFTSRYSLHQFQFKGSVFVYRCYIIRENNNDKVYVCVKVVYKKAVGKSYLLQ